LPADFLLLDKALKEYQNEERQIDWLGRFYSAAGRT
jgi:hypothetical protein